MIQVVVADDEAVVRGGHRMILEVQAGIEVVGEAGDGRRALELVDTLDPDVVLMDIRMPVLDGIEATRRLLTVGPGLASSCSPPTAWTRTCTPPSRRGPRASWPRRIPRVS